MLLAAAASGGLTAGVLLTFFGFGLRHGVDWDHIAAISDITGSQDERRRGFVLATLYAAGHAAVVLALGALAIVVGARVPKGLDAVMSRVVGITLVALGVYVLVSMARDRRDFRLRSRWMLVFAFVRRLHARRASGEPAVVEHEHEHGDSGHHTEVHVDTMHADSAVKPVSTEGRVHHHRHRHVGAVPDDPFVDYGVVSATGVGMLHGIGAETPTQVLVLAAAAGVGGAGAGIPLLLSFVAGLVCSNTLVAVGTTYGLRRDTGSFVVYAAVSAVVALASIVIGALFLLGRDAALPAILG